MLGVFSKGDTRKGEECGNLVLMVIVILVLLGLCFGSFINALVWRIRQQSKLKAQSPKLKAQKTSLIAGDFKLGTRDLQDLSILRGRSMCVHCHHILAWYDLLPVLSWLSLNGKCRYCHKPIYAQYPIVELITAGLFLLSYSLWPEPLIGFQLWAFSFWLVALIGLIALAVYDLKWFLLPNKIVYPMIYFALATVLIRSILFTPHLNPFNLSIVEGLLSALYSLLIGGGLFYLIFQISNGKWIGGGDVKLGALLGLILADPGLTLLMIFLASLLGTVVTLPLLALKRVKKDSHIPFGPFLIAGTILARLFGAALIAWYRHLLIY